MLLNALPTEPDTHVLGFLSSNDVARISHVSEYCHEQAEPLLYRHIELKISR